MINTITLIRPLNVLLGGIAVAITTYILNHPTFEKHTIYIYMVVMFFIGASNVLNDIFDYNSDKTNHPSRPIPSGMITKNQALCVSCILFLLGIYCALNLNTTSQYISLGIVLPIIILYTPLLKPIPLIGNIAISIVLGFVFIFTEVALTSKMNIMIIPACLASYLTLIREMVKDIQDVVGDKKQNINTFPIKYGISITISIIRILLVVLCFIVFIPFILNIYGIQYLFTVFFGVIFPAIYSIFFLKKHPTPTGSKRISVLLKISTVCGLISFIFINNSV